MKVQEVLLRLPEIIGRRATTNDAGIPALIPVSQSTWYEGIKSGRFPKPVRISARCVAWRASEIARVVEHLTQAGAR